MEHTNEAQTGRRPRTGASRAVWSAALALLAVVTFACASDAPPSDGLAPPPHPTATADELLVVDCLLPGQVRKLGRQFNYLSPRRPIKTSAIDCEIRGGEYVAYDRANYATALAVWLPAAEDGDAEAQNYVGEIFERGLGREPDYETAAKWYAKAAEQGFSAAQINLGQLYEHGLGVVPDVTKALAWYDRAAGLVGGQWELVSGPELASLRDELEVRSAEAEGLRSELAGARTQIERVRKQRSQRERDAAAALAALTQERNTLAEERRRLEAEAEEIRVANQTLAKRKTEEGERELLREAGDAAEIAARTAALEAREKELLKQSVALGEAAAEVARRSHAIELERDRLGQERTAPAPPDVVATNEALRVELAAREKRLAALQEKVAAGASQLEAEQRKIAQERGELAAIAQARSALETFARELGERESVLQLRLTQLEARSGDLASAQTTVDGKREEIAALNAEIEKLRAEAEAQRQQLAAVAEEKTGPDVAVAIAGPSIQMIDPLLVATRDAPGRPGLREVPMAAGIEERVIVGRVEAPAGLLSLTINDLAAPTGPNGLFQTNVAVQPGGTEVAIVAVDRQGERSNLHFLLTSDEITPLEEAAAPIAPKPSLIPSDVDFGNYYALVIGNDDYQQLPDLESAINDADAVSETLEKRYAFNVTTLRNANRYQILSALNQLTATLTKRDNLLVYYAGHGELDRVNQVGHWLPVDAEPENPANWLSTRSLTDQLNRMKARHIIVVADSCYSGALTRSAVTQLKQGELTEERVQWLRAQLGLRVRTALTSGGLKPVLDSGDGKHSLFAKSLLDVLNSNKGVLDGLSLYQAISARVVQEARELDFDQMPEYAPIRHGHHENGHFLFVPRV